MLSAAGKATAGVTRSVLRGRLICRLPGESSASVVFATRLIHAIGHLYIYSSEIIQQRIKMSKSRIYILSMPFSFLFCIRRKSRSILGDTDFSFSFFGFGKWGTKDCIC
jgi:hypothetical protein